MRILTGFATIAALIALVSLAHAQSATPGTADEKGTMMDCSEAGMTHANSSMMKMPDASKKEAAMKEMGMAKEMMGKKDMAGCKMHMGKAMGMMK